MNLKHDARSSFEIVHVVIVVGSVVQDGGGTGDDGCGKQYDEHPVKHHGHLLPLVLHLVLRLLALEHGEQPAQNLQLLLHHALHVSTLVLAPLGPPLPRVVTLGDGLLVEERHHHWRELNLVHAILLEISTRSMLVCSAVHRQTAVTAYLSLLKKIQSEVKLQLVLVFLGQ